MRVGIFVVLALASSFGCRRKAGSSGHDAGFVNPGAEAAQITPFLPERVGPFSSASAATTNFTAAEPRMAAERVYNSTDGRTLTIELITGDLRPELRTLASDADHAFGSDTPTYWRTTSIRGWRTRIAEARPTPVRSECYVQVGPNHVAHLDVSPVAKAGESASLAALLDLEGLARSGGIPGPPLQRTR